MGTQDPELDLRSLMLKFREIEEFETPKGPRFRLTEWHAWAMKINFKDRLGREVHLCHDEPVEELPEVILDLPVRNNRGHPTVPLIPKR